MRKHLYNRPLRCDILNSHISRYRQCDGHICSFFRIGMSSGHDYFIGIYEDFFDKIDLQLFIVCHNLRSIVSSTRVSFAPRCTYLFHFSFSEETLLLILTLFLRRKTSLTLPFSRSRNRSWLRLEEQKKKVYVKKTLRFIAQLKV